MQDASSFPAHPRPVEETLLITEECSSEMSAVSHYDKIELKETGSRIPLSRHEYLTLTGSRHIILIRHGCKRKTTPGIVSI